MRPIHLNPVIHVYPNDVPKIFNYDFNDFLMGYDLVYRFFIFHYIHNELPGAIAFALSGHMNILYISLTK